jgi:general stress protein CsbA
MTYSIVACAPICKKCAENTIPVLLFTGRCQVTAGCFVATILASSEYATLSKHYSLACRFVWVLDVVSHIKGSTMAEVF